MFVLLRIASFYEMRTWLRCAETNPNAIVYHFVACVKRRRKRGVFCAKGRDLRKKKSPDLCKKKKFVVLTWEKRKYTITTL